MRRWSDKSVQMCVTSPPYYGLRDYGVDGQLGLEETPEEYIKAMVEVFREVKRVLKDDGTLWVNIGDSYYNYRPGKGQRQGKQSIAGQKFSEVQECHKRGRVLEGFKEKDLIGIPWMLAFALRADGWYLRQDIIWHKPNPMPERVKDRCTKAHEYIFLLSKSKSYYYDSAAISEDAKPESAARYNYTFANETEKHAERVSGGMQNIAWNDGMRESDGKRNKRSVWTVTTKPYSGAHFATFPMDLIEPCTLAGSRIGDTVLDPFIGSGTTAKVCIALQREYVGCELNPNYIKLQEDRVSNTQMEIL